MSGVNASRARALGAELRDARTAAGLTQEQVAEQMGKQHSVISRYEGGRRAPSETDAAALCGIYGVTGDERDRIVQLAREAADVNWVVPGVNKTLASLIEDEKAATSIVNVEPLMIPGLVQVEEYIRAIMIAAGAPRGEADQRVLVRLGRQALLRKRRRPQFLAIIGESALRYPPCDRDTMIEQLQYLLDIGESPNVTIQVLPLDVGYTAALEGSFTLMAFERGDPVVHQENYRSTTALTDRNDVADYQAAVEDLRRQALSPEETAGHIAKLISEWEREG